MEEVGDSPTQETSNCVVENGELEDWVHERHKKERKELQGLLSILK